MRRTFALLLFAGLASSAHADPFDDWCKTAHLPSSIAICSDPELLALTRERQQAYEEAKARLGTEQQKMLLADQNAWVRSYPRACGLTDAPPSLPLSPEIKDCMAQAGRARIAYLKAYGGTSGAPSETNGASDGTTSAPTQPEQAGAQYRCRDPNTNFVYERSEPCAKGDLMLSGPPSIPNEQAPQSEQTVPADIVQLNQDPFWNQVYQDILAGIINNRICRPIESYVAEDKAKCMKTWPNDQEDFNKCMSSYASWQQAGRQIGCPGGEPSLAAPTAERQLHDKLITSDEFAINKDQWATTNKQVTLRGTFIHLASGNYLLSPNTVSPTVYGQEMESSPNVIPLLITQYTAKEFPRKVIQCEEEFASTTETGCQVLIGGDVTQCQVTVFLTGASHEEACINVIDGYVIERVN